ncbi:MAG: hypothetical protein NC127_00205 [Muribaculum sp.]|nr:hypothetical protein [Muribaculum sp.]
MYNVASKPIIAGIIAATLCLGGCSSKSAERIGAEQLVASADSAIKVHNYDEALTLLDTLKAKYPAEIEMQRQGMHLRPQAIEGQTIRELQTTDSLRAYYEYVADSLKQYFSLVHNPELGEDYDYYVIREYKNSNLFNRTGIEARVEPSGELRLISSLVGHPAVKHTKIALVQKNQGSFKVESAEVPYDGERNYRSGSTEMITFIGAECDTLGSYLVNGAPKDVMLTFRGAKVHSLPLSKNDRKSLELSYKFAQATAKHRNAVKRLDFLNKQLMIARDQAARTSQDPE